MKIYLKSGKTINISRKEARIITDLIFEDCTDERFIRLKNKMDISIGLLTIDDISAIK